MSAAGGWSAVPLGGRPGTVQLLQRVGRVATTALSQRCGLEPCACGLPLECGCISSVSTLATLFLSHYHPTRCHQGNTLGNLQDMNLYYKSLKITFFYASNPNVDGK